MIISAFSGAGKTYLSQSYKEIIDLEPMNYHWIYPEDLSQKNTEAKKKYKKRVENPDWPQNYIRDILAYHKKGYLVLISGNDQIVSYLSILGVECINVFPTPDQKDSYLARYLKRGNNSDYIDYWDNHFEYHIIQKQHLKNKIEMYPDEYLEDTLIRNGILSK